MRLAISLEQGIGADFARAYLSNVCVAKELHRNGLGYLLVAKSKIVAQDWGKNPQYIFIIVVSRISALIQRNSCYSLFVGDRTPWVHWFLSATSHIVPLPIWTFLVVCHQTSRHCVNSLSHLDICYFPSFEISTSYWPCLWMKRLISRGTGSGTLSDRLAILNNGFFLCHLILERPHTLLSGFHLTYEQTI